MPRRWGMSDAVVIIDYQNVHLTAHNRFCPDSLPRHESLIHPLHFALQLLQARRLSQQAAGYASSVPTPSLSQVVVFRGLPGNKQQPDAYRRNLAQQSNWTRDPRVEVHYRPLTYTTNYDGSWTAQEKGVDVQVAIEVVKAIDSARFELVVLAAHDTDLIPALEYGFERERDGDLPAVETAGWTGCKRLRVPGHPAWHT